MQLLRSSTLAGWVLWSCLWSGTAASAATQFPIRYQDGLLWAEVRVEQHLEALHFLLDSGASVSAVNLHTAEQLGLRLGSKVDVAAVGASLHGFWPVPLAARVGDVALPSDFLALDLDRLSAACGQRVDGLIGADFFRERIVEIDYQRETVRLLDATPSHHSGANAVRLKTHAGGFRVSVQVNGGRRRPVRLDTGCASAFHWVTSEAPAGTGPSKTAVGLTEMTLPETTSRLQIGKHALEAVPTGLHGRAIFAGESGLLGNGVLSQFGVIVLDARAGRLILGRL